MNRKAEITSKKGAVVFVITFLAVFLFLYYGTLAMIGLAAPGGYYSPFIEQYLDYVSWIKQSLLWGVGTIFHLAGVNTQTEPGFLIRIVHQRGVYIAMDCVGYGVYSFWMAYVIANRLNWKQKLAWIIGGVFALWLINVFRIALFLRAINRHSEMPLGIDHHTWFTIIAYCAIFILMYFFNKSADKHHDHQA